MKNRIITTSESDNEIITLYKKVNNVVFNVNNFRALDCKVYTHVFKIIKRYKLDNRN